MDHLDIGQTTIDPLQKPRHKRRVQQVYIYRKKRRLELQQYGPHHKQVYGRFNKFLFKQYKDKKRYVVVYDYYLDAVCCGIDPTFNNFHTDPMLAKDLHDFNSRVKRLRDAIAHFTKRGIKKRLTLSPELRNEFYQKSRREQEHILMSLKFEFLNANIKFITCQSCHTKSLGLNFSGDTAKVCNKCVNLKMKDNNGRQNYYLNNNMLPVWYDEHKQIHFDIPLELQDLTHCEKMLIQKYSVLCPVVHIGHGAFGIKGHTCCFRKLNYDIATTLPRSNIDLIVVVKETKGRQGLDDVEKQYYNVRRSKVISALKWLKDHHRGYSDITIDENSLSWMNREEQNLPDDRMRYVQRTVSMKGTYIFTRFQSVFKNWVLIRHFSVFLKIGFL